jgi:hypothetical protein
MRKAWPPSDDAKNGKVPLAHHAAVTQAMPWSRSSGLEAGKARWRAESGRWRRRGPSEVVADESRHADGSGSGWIGETPPFSSVGAHIAVSGESIRRFFHFRRWLLRHDFHFSVHGTLPTLATEGGCLLCNPKTFWKRLRRVSRSVAFSSLPHLYRGTPSLPGNSISTGELHLYRVPAR